MEGILVSCVFYARGASRLAAESSVCIQHSRENLLKDLRDVSFGDNITKIQMQKQIRILNKS